MRKAGLLAVGVFAAGVVTASLAIAQSRGSRPARPAAPPRAPQAASDNPYDDPRDGPAPSASAASPERAAPRPPPAAEAPGDVVDGGRRSSPLNPAPDELPDAGAPPESIDYDRLLADIGALRARVAAAGDLLFHSRIALTVATRGDHARVASLAVSLDDGVVWTSPATLSADDATTVYDHAVAPGHHAVTVDVERRDDRDDAFRSTQRSRFVVDVPADQRLTVDLELRDDSDMGDAFPSDRKGSYDLRVRARVHAQPVPR